MAPWHDDIAGILSIYSTGRPETDGWVTGFRHGLTTTPGMIGVIDAVIGGGLAVTIAIGLGFTGIAPVIIGIAAVIGVFLVIAAVFARAVMSMDEVPARFPSPPRADGTRRPGRWARRLRPPGRGAACGPVRARRDR